MPIESPERRAQETVDLLWRVYEIHDRIIRETGGLEGVRDFAMLHAAVGRPFATFADEDLYTDEFEKAAAPFHSLIKSHPFMDGTKRTAFASALYFWKCTAIHDLSYSPKTKSSNSALR